MVLSRRAALKFGIGSAAAVVAGRGVLAGSAQEGTPGAGEETGAVDEAAVAGSVRYQHPEKRYFYWPGFGDEAVVAAVHGLDVATYRRIKAGFDLAARGAAEALLEDEAFGAMVERLPFRAGETVLGIGASGTDDLQSWLEILRHLLELRRGDEGIRVVNQAVSGQTTTEALRYFPGTVGMAQPRWVICSLGGNDLTRVGAKPEGTLIGREETEGNLAAIRRVVVADPAVTWVWMNQWPMDEARVALDPGFQMGQASWRNEDADALNAFYERQPEPVVDLQAVFGRPVLAELLEADGLHPSLAGQTVTARAVVERLAG